LPIHVEECIYTNIFEISTMVKVRLSLPTPLRCKGGISPTILDLGTGWRTVVIFPPRPLYVRLKKSLYPLISRLCGSEPVWTFPRSWKYLSSFGNRISIPRVSSLWCSTYSSPIINVNGVNVTESLSYVTTHFCLFIRTLV